MPRPIKRELTYFAPRKCYKRSLDGRMIYVGKGSERDTVENYQRAWLEWEQKTTSAVVAGRRQEGGLMAIAETFNLVEGSGSVPSADAIRAILVGTQHEGGEMEKRLIALAHSKTLPAFAAGEMTVAETVETMCKKFVESKRLQAKIGQISVGRFATVQSYAETFRDFVGATKDVTALTGPILSDYHALQLVKLDGDDISCTGAAGQMQVAKQFYRFCYEQEQIILPRNFESRSLNIACSAGEIKPMPLSAFLERYKIADGRMKLELLLMANCGFYQQDCGDLRHTEIDWKEATITRRRSKKQKGKEKDIPMVKFFLWERTMKLLRELADTSSEFVLRTRCGHQVVRDYINEAGEAVHVDAVAQAYTRLQSDMKEKWPLKSIRKTSSSLIGNHAEFGKYVLYFLGQSAATVAEGHYVKPSDVEFKKCLTWLEGQYHFDGLVKK